MPRASRRGHGPYTDPHPEPTNVRPVVEADLLESAVPSEDVAQLIHRGAPAKALVDVVENGRGVGFTDIAQVLRDLFTQPLGSTHQASPRTQRP